MAVQPGLDCVVIGYNEMPFGQWEELLRQYGEDSEAYRDLKLSFVSVGGRKLTYVDLLNEILSLGAATGRAALRSGDIPNLAAAYLTSFLRRQGLTADSINLFQEEKERLARLLQQGPLCVAITTTLYVVNQPVNEMTEFIRRHNPEVRIVAGGPLVSNHARNYDGDGLKTALADMGADLYVIEGQGEATLAAIIRCLKQGGDLGSVPNLAYLEGGELRRTPEVPENNSLDENYVNWRLLSEDDLGVTLQTRTARSCAFKCAFCNYPTRAGKLTLASVSTLEKELDSMASRGNVRNLIFIDDTFNVPLPRFKDLCRLMIRKRYGFDWFSYFRCSNSDEEAIELMAESGCKGVFLGIESGSPRILENMDKVATVDKYLNGIRRLREHGILTFGSFIIGFPGETRETVEETLDFIRGAGLDYFRAQLWYNEPGTPIHDRKEKYGIEGEGFVWRHATMDSLEAMEHIERIFLTVEEAVWLPQWSFDFWILPDLFGKGISPAWLKTFLGLTHKMLALEIASLEHGQKQRLQQKYLDEMAGLARSLEAAA